MVFSPRISRCFFRLLLFLALGTHGVSAKKGEPAMAPGTQVQLIRDELLKFYDKPLRQAKSGEKFEVLQVRAESKQVFVGVKQGGKLIAVSVSLDAVKVLKDKGESAENAALADALFEGLVPVVKIQIEPEAMEKLRKEPRNYVRATLVEAGEAGGKTYTGLGVKLKGSAGSFQPIDARPGFSFNMEKFDGEARFHGLKRFQFNNGAQDGTVLNELIAGEVARKAGVPASRCTHALVTLNEKPLGIYVLKEGISTKDFLGRFFADPGGNLYDGGFVAEIRKEMEVDRGDPDRKERLLELVAAIWEADQTKQNAQVEKLVDVDAYLRYVVLENILCHWDGYSFNRNNYRIYENPLTGKFYFLLHGMDQVFGDAGWSVRRPPGAAVGSVVWRKPENQARYNVILQEVYETVIKPVDWVARVEEVGRRLQAALAKVDPERAKAYEPQIVAERDKIRRRMEAIQRQMQGYEISKALAGGGKIELGRSVWGAQVENAQSEEVEYDGRRCLALRATGDCNASWRLTLSVPPGTYRFEGEVSTKGVRKLPNASGEGAGLRISGGSRQVPNALDGENTWQRLSYDFTSGGGDAVLVVELRAKAGQMWVDRKTLKITRIR